MKATPLILLAALLLPGCVSDTLSDTPAEEPPEDVTQPDAERPRDRGPEPDAAMDLDEDASPEPLDAALGDAPEMMDLDWVPPCEAEPCPIVIEGFPFQDIRDTQTSVGRFERYGCAPQTNESGPEFSYVFKLDEPGTLLLGVRDGEGVDIDLHLLDALDPGACLARHDEVIGQHLDAGIYFIVADTWVNSGGQAQPGEFEMSAHFVAQSGPCGMATGRIPRIGTDDLLPMPATGPVVLEAHLMTAEEHEENVASDMGRFPSGWPQSFTDGIEHHYELSEAASGFRAERGEPWAPCCEPSNEFGQGSSARPPAIAEAWYINMRWRQRPDRGERYIVLDPFSGRAVVGAAGYENGPGALDRIGGAAEEIHIFLDTRHLSTMTFGVALDQALPYGPIDCNAE